MSKTIIIYTDHLRYELQLTEDKKVLLAASEKAQLYLPHQETPIQLQLAKGQVFYQMGEETGVVTDGLALDNLTLYQSDSEPAVYDLLDRKELLISDQKGAAISLEVPLELLLKRTNDSWLLTKMRGQVFLNHVEWTGDQIQLEAGDELSLEGICLKVYPEEIWVTGPATVSSNLTLRGASRHGFYPDYPDYHRSPRIIYRSSEDKIQIAPPSKEPQKPNDELLRLIVPPLLMVGVTVLITLVQPRGIYILVTVTMSIASAIFSVRGFFKNRKKFKEDKKERIDLYHLYLKDKAIELNKLEREQRDGMLYHFPNINELTGLVTDYSHRIYEKTPLHFDFLYYRLGLGQVPTSYKLTYGQEERSGKKDALEEEGYALYTRHKKIPDLPIVANLSHGPVGYIGPRNLVLEQLQLLVMQLAVFHSYHDVQVITIMPEEERDQWDWLRWLPHATLQELNVRGFVYNQRTHDQVLNSLNQILKLRKAQKEEATRQETTLYSPHYVVLVTDEKLILDHIIMEFFTEDPTDLGCSLIFVQDVMSSLSENIKTVINIKDRNTGQLVMEEGILREIDFRLDHFPEGYDKERIARTLAPLNHLQNLKSSIPDTVTFMEMYGAETFSDLQVLQKWQQNAPYKSLAVPIGLRGKEDLVYLNLHEKAHGPHGLIAGTIGVEKVYIDGVLQGGGIPNPKVTQHFEQLNSRIKDFDPEVASTLQKSNSGEILADDNMRIVRENVGANGNTYTLESIGRPAPGGIDDPIVKGIDGIYKNQTPPPSYVINETKWGSSQINQHTKSGPQMSQNWVRDRLGNLDPMEQISIERALETGDVDFVISKVDETGNILTYRAIETIDSTGNVIGVKPGGVWP